MEQVLGSCRFDPLPNKKPTMNNTPLPVATFATSEAKTLNTFDWKRIGFIAIITGISAIVTYLLSVVNLLPQGWQPVVTAILTLLGYGINKWQKDNTR